ncbi:hypothetical protein BJ170DRAFT_586708 [Xylariales sp. AK1849]|nr:hypothetical protein BJ170DRAFT_586708 [Xylariales sp. AK1849]
MRQTTVSASLSKAYSLAGQERRQSPPPIIYYQTDTLLQYHPSRVQFCVTHHGPFVSHFTQQFSLSLAQMAFGGNSDKVTILEQQQQSGIQRLLRDELGTVLAHSGLQQRVIQEQGLEGARFKRLSPPIGLPKPERTSALPDAIVNFVSSAHVLLFTAVARLDYFKNVELLVEVGLELIERGVPVKILIVGDPNDDEVRRHTLLRGVPCHQRDRFLIVPRLSKDHLYTLFAATQNNGIFLCPSRYETLGITPLEAAASGVTTLITNSSNVEALAYLPANCRVSSQPASIATRIQRICHDGINVWGSMVNDHVRPTTSLQAFQNDLLKAWSEMSSSGLNASALLDPPSNCHTAKGATTSMVRFAKTLKGTMRFMSVSGIPPRVST